MCKLTLPESCSYQISAWFLDSTLQSNIPLSDAGLALATDRPIFTGSLRVTRRSWNGWELGWHVNTARPAMVASSASSPELERCIQCSVAADFSKQGSTNRFPAHPQCRTSVWNLVWPLNIQPDVSLIIFPVVIFPTCNISHFGSDLVYHLLSSSFNAIYISKMCGRLPFNDSHIIL